MLTAYCCHVYSGLVTLELLVLREVVAASLSRTTEPNTLGLSVHSQMNRPITSRTLGEVFFAVFYESCQWNRHRNGVIQTTLGLDT